MEQKRESKGEERNEETTERKERVKRRSCGREVNMRKRNEKGETAMDGWGKREEKKEEKQGKKGRRGIIEGEGG